MARPVSLARPARKLLIVPVLVAGLYVASVEAPAAPPEGRGNWGAEADAGGNGLSKKPYATGDGRRMR